MKLSKMALAAAISCAVYAGTATAQGLRQPASVHQTNYTHSYYAQDGQPSPSDLPPTTEPEPALTGDFGCDTGCDTACDTCGPVHEDCPQWYLFNQDNCHNVSVRGWLNGGYFTNSRNTNSRYNGPVTFADRRDGQINQVYGIIEKAIDTSDYCWDVGGRLDLLYGTDWIYNYQTGWEASPSGDPLDGWNSNPYYGLVTPQAYVEAGYGDLSIKAGRFYTILGYEVVTAPDNFFATHAYTMQYGEPFTHTGLLGTWDYNDNWTFVGGIVNGWNRFYGSNNAGIYDRVAGIGGAVYTPDHGRYSIALTGITGSEPGSNVYASTTRSMYSLVFNWKVTDRLTYVIQHDNAWQDAVTQNTQTGELHDAEWYGVNQYLFYTINDCWKAGARAEWFRDDDGFRVHGIRPTSGTDTGNPTGYNAGNYWEVSLGLNWTPHSNLIVRPEVRYDWFDGQGNPFGDGQDKSQWVGGFDAIVLW
jgi:hypothetical protein